MLSMRKALALALALVLLVSVAYQLEVYPPLPDESRLVAAYVEHVVDGDTIWAQVEEDGIQVTHKVRLLIVDTPETVHPDRGEEPGGIIASGYTKMMLEGQEVWLEYDRERTDVYGRQLCHVWLKDGTLFTLHLVEQGYGQMKIYPPNTRYQNFFVAAQQYAKENSLGIWEEKLRIHEMVGVRAGASFQVETEEGVKIYMLDHNGTLWLQGVQGSWGSTTAADLIYIINNPEKVRKP